MHLKHASFGLMFIIDFSSFHNGLKQLCSLKLVSILSAALWKVVIKCKIVMFFSIFGLFFSNCSYLRFQNFISPSIKYPINLIFSVVVCVCKVYVFNGVIPCQIIQNFWIKLPLSHGFFLKFSPVVGIIEI